MHIAMDIVYIARDIVYIARYIIHIALDITHLSRDIIYIIGILYIVFSQGYHTNAIQITTDIT